MWTLTELPIVQAPMAGSQGPQLCIAVCAAGGLGSIPCAMLTPDVLRAQISEIRAATKAPRKNRIPNVIRQTPLSFQLAGRLAQPGRIHLCIAFSQFCQ